MTGILADLKGMKFGKLTCLEVSDVKIRNRRSWKCLCECGNIKILQTQFLLKGQQSCGCLHAGNVKHGHANEGRLSRTYYSWAGMKGRCNVTSHGSYKNYGGRGIKVCERWNSFTNFLADMGERPEETSLDRIDPNGNYEPANCRWASLETQANNKRKGN